MLNKRHKLAIAGAVGGVVLGAAGIGGVVRAQTGQSTPSNNNQQAQQNTFWQDLAKNLNIDPNTLQGAVKTTQKQEVDKAAAAGKLTPTQAQNIKNAIDNGTARGPFGHGGIPGGGANRQNMQQV